VEELEKTSSSLTKLCESQQVQLELKTATVQDLEEKLDSVQNEYGQMKERCESMELSHVQQTLSNRDKATRKKAASFNGELSQDTVDCLTMSQREQDLVKAVEELTEKLRTANYQRGKYEKGLQEVVAENQTLSRSLERVEADAGELQARLRAYEDAMEKQSLERSYSSPMPHSGQHLSVSSTPTSTVMFQYTSGLPSPSGEESNRPSARTADSLLGTSLFSELDSQYSDLQERYDQLVQQCTCSAGLAHRNQMKLSAADGSGDVLHSLAPSDEASSVSPVAPFKDLFEEVFATLKQTAAVADKLAQRKKNAVM
jgi:DNA repair exonuclease SbcCD ATPase subunit